MAEETHSTMHLMTWLSGQFSHIHAGLGALREGQTAMRHRLERLEARIHGGQHSWLKHLPWTRITLMMIGALLLITGHLTVTEIKSWLARAIAGN
jgi:hypothetical protein